MYSQSAVLKIGN